MNEVNVSMVCSTHR